MQEPPISGRKCYSVAVSGKPNASDHRRLPASDRREWLLRGTSCRSSRVAGLIERLGPQRLLRVAGDPGRKPSLPLGNGRVDSGRVTAPRASASRCVPPAFQAGCFQPQYFGVSRRWGLTKCVQGCSSPAAGRRVEPGLTARRDCERPVEPSCGFSRALRLSVAT